ncbi:MAG TPA: phosphatidate cytidylyltransferase [Candidatus Acidoferrales bacterium]|nr:phosphatidate cytidylyltransferase [Candidatus Acidoferrales bacterium]
MTLQRVLTAIVLIPIVVAVVMWASLLWVAVAFGLVIVLALVEYFALGEMIGHRGYLLWTGACALALVFVQFLTSRAETFSLAGGLLLERSSTAATLTLFPFLLFVFVLGAALIVLANRQPLAETLPALGISASGLLFVALPLSFGVPLHGMPRFGPRLLLFALVLVWAGDTAAYFTGRSIGRWKMAPSLSPNKTWEGAAANLLASLVVGMIFARWTGIGLRPMLVGATLANIAGQIGDLVESAYKRSAGAKDSGGLLPGHGGMLDRIDALVFAVPVVWYYFKLVL